MIHELKTWTKYYGHVATYKKRFEIRFNDRNYQVGDTLHLKEWEPETKQYTGQELKTEILYIFSLENVPHVVLSISEPYDIRRVQP